MKIIILLLFLGMIIPVFAQESPLNDVTVQLENQINQSHLKELKNKTSNIENIVEQTISKINVIENQNFEFNQRLEKLENTNNSLENINISLENTNTSLKNIKDSVDDSNYTNLILIAISLFVAVGSMLFAGVQGYLLRKQTSLVEKEQKLHLRPWIVPTYVGPTYVNLKNDGIDWEKWATDRVKYPESPISVNVGSIVKNIGPLPALFRSRGLIGPTEITKEILEKEPFSTGEITLFPQQETKLTGKMDYSTFAKITDNGKLWIAYEVEYDLDENTITCIGVIGYMDHGTLGTSLSWHKDRKK